MSYEGFIRRLCANGHQRIFDAYDEAEGNCSCGAEFVWFRSVDETNGYEPESDPPLEVAVPEVICICDKCGIPHRMEEARYKIPGREA